MAKFGIIKQFYQLTYLMKLHASRLKTSAFVAALSALFLVGCNQGSNAKPAEKTDNTTSTTQSTSEKTALHNTAAQNSDPNHNPEVANALQANLNKAGIDVHVTSVVPSGMPDIFWVTLDGAQPVFTDKTGKYLFQGAMVELGGDKPIDTSARLQSTGAKTALAALDKKDMIIFNAKGQTKAAIYVFSDPTCHYCQKLHEEIADTTAQGIEVRYLAWPRGQEVLPLAEAIWCSKDRKDALTRAKKGEKITADACTNPVSEQIALGYSLGVSGTPAIFAENGTQLGGYLPSAELAKSAITNKN